MKSWLLTTDHKRIGIMYLLTTTFMLLLGGLFATILRLEHLTPGPTLMTPMTYNRLFTLHGVVMVWLFMIPSIPTAFGNYFLPIMVGAPEMAFPRLNLLSYWVYVAGSIVVLAAMLLGGVDTGWTFYPPYSTSSPTAVTVTVIGIFITGISSILTGINFMSTTHGLRIRGLRWMKMPLFVWAIYGTSIIQVMATPVLGMALFLVAFDRITHAGVFGDPILFQHLFWFYSHPAVYIMILPAMGVISEVVCTMAHKNPFSYTAIAVSSLGIAFVGFLTWGHHMFVAGMSTVDAGIFGVLSMLVAVFSAIKVFNWTWTLKRGAIIVTTPLIYVFAFLFLFVFGGMTGVAVATMSLDVHWHDTYFVVAHFHFVMVGGTVTGFLAALFYWFPRMSGRKYSERAGVLAATLVFAGFFVTFFPQFLLGNAGMPRRYFFYPEHLQTLHVISTVGSWIIGVGILAAGACLFHALFWGERSEMNPWKSRSYEWREPQRFDIGPYDYEVAE